MLLGRLQEQRERAALSQRELTEATGVTPMTIYRIEHGKDARPTTTRKLARALKLKPSDLMLALNGERRRTPGLGVVG
jgi:transcriptional regulator with XRE-family HTH domain